MVAGFELAVALICAVVFAGMLGALMLGRRLALARTKRAGGDSEAGVGAMNAAVFGLLGLLIAFTFSGAATRFEGRRALIVQEANAIGTAYLRLDLLMPDARAELQEKFRRYVDARLSAYRSRSMEEFRTTEARALGLQGEIWSQAVIAAEAKGRTGVPAAQVLLPALNEVIDISTTRTAAFENHPPSVIFAMLIVLAFLSALVAGMGMSPTHPSRVASIAFAAATSVTIYVTMDMEYPRRGLINISDADHLLADARRNMK